MAVQIWRFFLLFEGSLKLVNEGTRKPSCFFDAYPFPDTAFVSQEPDDLRRAHVQVLPGPRAVPRE